MTTIAPTSAALDTRFSDPAAEPLPWPQVAAALAEAELYWLSTVRTGGRPHVTPLIGLWHDGAWVFCTGEDEQKARNLAHEPRVAVTTGANRWSAGLDVVLEGTAERLADQVALHAVAEAYVAKYGEVWRFEVGDGVFQGQGSPGLVFRVRPAKVMAFAKEPHGQTTYRF